MATYGDGLSDLDLGALLDFHREKGCVATLTSVRPHSPFGLVHIDAENMVSSFEEKPVLDHWINGGFFVFDRRIFDYIEENDVLEKKPFVRLAQERELAAFKFKGFWKCMDTYKDHLELNDLWTKGRAHGSISGRKRSHESLDRPQRPCHRRKRVRRRLARR